jgi:hypothetical protein
MTDILGLLRAFLFVLFCDCGRRLHLQCQQKCNDKLLFSFRVSKVHTSFEKFATGIIYRAENVNSFVCSFSC